VNPVQSADEHRHDVSQQTLEQPQDADRRSKSAARGGRLVSVLLAACVLGYLAAVVGVLALMWSAGDRTWPATLALFGPRWVYALPLLVLAPAVLAWRRVLVVPLAAGAVIALGPIMGFSVPWGRIGDVRESELRVVTFNVEGGSVTEEEFMQLLTELEPDVVAVQEYDPSARWRIPEPWHVCRSGELMVVSRFPIERIEVSRCAWPPQRYEDQNGLYCILRTPQGPVGFCNVHLDTPRKALGSILNSETVITWSNTDYAEERIEFRRRESADMAEWLRQFDGPLIIAGDFNMPVNSLIYREYWSGFDNAFSRTGLGYGYTKMTTIRRVQFGTRIDHVLTDSKWRPTRSWLGSRMGSDHRPLIAELALDGDARTSRTTDSQPQGADGEVAQGP
jgi:endonuclease/exonuclease/phosphatase (EEP) superfamily protein YafD